MPRIRDPNAPFWQAMHAAEKQVIEDALAATGGDVQAAAARLGIDRGYCIVLMKRRGIVRADFLRGRPPQTRQERAEAAAEAASGSWLATAVLNKDAGT